MISTILSLDTNMPSLNTPQNKTEEEPSSSIHCEVCKKGFTSKDTLRRHSQLHKDGNIKIYKCPDCNKETIRKDNYKRHRKHCKPKKEVDNSCKHCGKEFNKPYNLFRHLHKKKSCVENKTNLVFQCLTCSKTFSCKRQLRLHIESNKCGQLKTEKDCPICHHKGTDLVHHFSIIHDIIIKSSEVSFSSMEEFYRWKANIQRTTNTKFVLEHKHFVCHRSGYFKSKSKGLRHRKVKGSNKINGYCPARMELQKNLDGTMKVKFVETHVGHDLDVDSIPLARESYVSESVRQIAVLTGKDLSNIGKSLNLSNDDPHHQNDFICLDAWVNETLIGGDSSQIMLYKPQGTTLELHPPLSNNDFALIIMTDAQKKRLKKYGPNFICVDRTYGRTGLKLTTILTLDKSQQVFPCAFLISNRSDTNIMHLFFKTIFEGITFETKLFMSDITDTNYKAWVSVLPPPQMLLYSSWSVLSTWRINLARIKNSGKRAEVYSKLRALMEESDTSTFSRMIHTVQQQLDEDPETEDYGKYFERYSDRETFKCWAYCHQQLYAGVNINKQLEQMHKTLKNAYMKGNKDKRLDKAIDYILKLSEDPTVTLDNDKVSPELIKINLRKRHDDSLSLCKANITKQNGYWIVPSNDNKKSVYQIKEANKSCKCDLRCDFCGCCIHAYTCTCNDSKRKGNMCKHIHLIIGLNDNLEDNFEWEPQAESLSPRGDLVINDKRVEENQEQVEYLNEANTESYLEERKQELLNELYSVVGSITSIAQYESMKAIANSMIPTLNAIRENENREQELGYTNCTLKEYVINMKF